MWNLYFRGGSSKGSKSGKTSDNKSNKKNESQSQNEKSKKPEPKPPTPVSSATKLQAKTPKPPTNQSHDLPAVQCKDTLLLNHDYNKQYSKRTVVSNWDRYAELPDNDEDDDNGQLTAPDFELLLTTPKSIDHFTLASERSWLENDASASDESSMASTLFKLNVANLKTGIGHLPFHLRQGLPHDMFTNDEIRDMNYRVNFFENENQNSREANPINQNLLNVLISNTDENVNNKSKTKIETSVSLVQDDKSAKIKSASESGDDLEELIQATRIQDQPTSIKLTPTTFAASSKAPTQIKTISQSSTKKPSNRTENIQDWLDDILNES